MEWLNIRRDWVALFVLVLSIVMIVSGLTGHSRTFGYSVMLFIGLLVGLGFVRRTRSTWWPPVVATAVLLCSLAGAFAFESVAVTSAADTTMGFQTGTAFVVYGIWIPAFFTLGVTYALLFDRLAEGEAAPAPAASEAAD